ncbi:bacteriophage holin [Candidatus Synchoanobacter obligatus]|uniref:Bacteriophage holin n=1 Tax=Candidatus Synchoanobacter obligatus TaxID=2919597 RepID=A0ABT1L4W7_9GAMM|nr:bacteriophage holin [Candidatus Synchoanobacter obligatus]MCP8352211.1 bacteriophage holin [Candidatus Synchoanobacter obligatus]
MKKLHTLAFAISLGLTWSISVILMSLLALYLGYAVTFVSALSTVYIGYELTALGILIGSGWAFLDGFIGGFLIAFIYNVLAKRL